MARFRRRTRFLLGTAITAVLFYLLGGFIGVPLIGRYLVLPQIAEQLQGSLSVEAIRFSPLRLQLILRGIDLKDADGHPALACQEVRVNASLTKSLWWRAIALDELAVIEPSVQVHFNEQGQLNLAGLVHPPTTPEPASEKPVAIPRIRIARSLVHHAAIDLRHDGLPEPFHHRLEQISLAFDRFDTSPVSENITRLDVHTVGGESLVWEGHVSLDPLSSFGRVTLADIDLPRYAPFLRLAAQARLQDGDLALAFDYAFAPLHAPPSVRIHDFSLSLRQLAMAPLASDQAFLALDELQIQDLDADLAQRTAGLKLFLLQNGRVRVAREADGTIDLLSMLQRAASAQAEDPQIREASTAEATTAPTATPTAATPVTGNPTGHQASSDDFLLLQRNLQELITRALDWEAWQVVVESIQIEGQALHWQDRAAPGPVDWSIAPLALQAGPIRSDQRYQIPYQLELTLLEQAQMRLQGHLAPLDQSLQSELSLQRLPLAPLAAYAPPGPEGLTLRRGELDLQGRLDADLTRMAEELPVPWVRFEGRLMARDLAAAGDTQAAPQAQVAAIELLGLQADTLPLSLVIETLRVIQPHGSVTLTLAEVPREGAAPTDTATPATSVEPDAAVESNIFGIPPLVYQAPVRIDLTEIQGGSAVLVDTAAPDQPLRVDEFQVRLSNLNSQSQEPAQLAVSMHLLNTATLSLQGPVRLLTAEPAADLAIALHTLPLPPTTPYAGPILGYALAQGTLTVDAQATLTAGSQLNINSQLLLDQIALGEAIQSPQRINAPVRLGLSLLRDSRGQIRTPLPRIYGDLNDPNFALGPVIVRTVVTLLTNVATAPFSLLASLVPGGGGGEATADLNQIRFLVGLADLDATAETVLDQLTLALKERPQLQLVVIGQAGPQDQWALRRNHLLAYLRERSQHPDALKVGSEAYRNAISRLYQRMGAPQPSDAQTLTSDAAARNTTASAGPRRPIPRTHRIGGAAQLPPTSAQEQEQATLGGALSTLFGIGGGDSTPETTSDLPPESSSDTSATNQPDTVAESTPDDATGPSDASTEVDTHEEALPFDQIEAIVLARMRMPENALENLASARADAVAAALVTRELATDRVQRRSEVLTNEPPDAGVASRVLFELQ